MGTSLIVPAETDAPVEDCHQYLTFMLGGETFGVGILSVKEIIEYHSLTAVPMMPDFIRGVINLRGAVVPVIDLATRFGRPASEVSRRTCIVIVELDSRSDTQVVGIVVDEVNEVVDIAAELIGPPPSFGANIRTDFIRGMGRLESQIVMLLDIDRVLSFNDLLLLGQAAQLGDMATEAAQ
jgi:purine-binding chemotaxis protein CheW